MQDNQVNSWAVIQGNCLPLLMQRYVDQASGPQLGRSFDHMITDPPYEPQAHTSARRARRGGGVDNLAIDFDHISDALRDSIGELAGELVHGWALSFCQVEAAGKWAAAFGDAYRRTMVWVKPDSAPQFTGDRPAQGYECISAAWCGDGRSKWNGGGRRGVLVHTLDHNRRQAQEHPTVKPLSLMMELVELFTNPGELVLDPFCGSGTTGVACLRLGRRFLGIELDPAYAELARERLAAEECELDLSAKRAGQLSIFGGDDA